jgi:hypothetical protein
MLVGGEDLMLPALVSQKSLEFAEIGLGGFIANDRHP